MSLCQKRRYDWYHLIQSQLTYSEGPPEGMSQENNNRFAFFATLLAFLLVGGISLILWAITGRLNRPVQVSSSSTNVAAGDSLPEEITARVSAGEEVLFPESSEEKQEAVGAIAQGNYASAITTLNAALDDEPNDPEAFIYRSNARIAEEDSVTVAVVLPPSEPTATLA